MSPSPHSDGRWFVRESDDAIEVIAPPGVRLLPRRLERAARPWIGGWRFGLWDCRREDRFADDDPPDHVRSLSTSDTLRRLGPSHTNSIENLMVEQLRAASAFGQPTPGELLDERNAQASAQLVAWILEELDDAFPGRRWTAPTPALPVSVVPDTFEELMRVLPAILRVEPCVPRENVYDVTAAGTKPCGKWDVDDSPPIGPLLRMQRELGIGQPLSAVPPYNAPLRWVTLRQELLEPLVALDHEAGPVESERMRFAASPGTDYDLVFKQRLQAMELQLAAERARRRDSRAMTLSDGAVGVVIVAITSGPAQRVGTFVTAIARAIVRCVRVVLSGALSALQTLGWTNATTVVPDEAIAVVQWESFRPKRPTIDIVDAPTEEYRPVASVS